MKRHRVLLVQLALLALTVGVYSQITQAFFVYEDRNWLAALTGNPRPVLNLAFWTLQLNVWWSGGSALGFHLTNLVLHLINGLLVYAIARAVVSEAGALVTMGLFLLHPLQVEAVAYSSGRPDLLSTTFVLVAVWAVTALLEDGAVWRCAAVALVASAGAVLAKSTAIVVVGLLVWVAMLWGPLPRWRTLAIGTVGMCAALVAWIWTSLGTAFDYATAPTLEFAGQQSLAVWRMLMLTVVPIGFSVDHDYALVPPLVGLFALGGLVTLSICAWGLRREAPWVALGLGWILIVVAPRLLMAGVYHPQLPEGLNEHHFYMASVGAYLTLVGVWESARSAVRVPLEPVCAS